ncbi:DUF4013 domain-containing protein [Methanobacterium paludis]|uniref:DUF4013 domain-containing protein n=1 Tax=Methanobacterium paludis (strain DSM 25820 / JCM 18151 / SWAN1) TaxID=868131 RepID=F6D6E4_METPW|nr:DUF4013 domain-containing protein [Methanobacterium paludis]AEG19377.1 hypothetical protein MSWAN_2373 [Methanobacterium paludis]
MRIDGTVSDSLKYPFSNNGRFLGLLALLLGSFLIIPAFFALGYLLRIVEHTIRGYDELPAFNDWDKMFVDGLKYIGANIIYLIVPTVILIVSLVGMILSVRSGNSQIVLYLFLLLIGLIISLLFNLVYIMALGNMAHNERFGAAFEFSTIFKFIKGIGWLTYFAYVFVFFIILGILGLFFNVSLWGRIFGLAGLVVGGILYLLFTVYRNIARSRFTGLMYLNGYFSTNTDTEADDNHEIGENQDFETV